MIIRVNMSEEVADYYAGYNLDYIVDVLLKEVDFMNLPKYSGKREVIRDVDVQNDLYKTLYNTLGPRSNKVSLSRLLEYGYNIDVISQYNIPIDDGYEARSEKDKCISLLHKAYINLLDASKIDNNISSMKDIVYQYMLFLKGEK